MDGFRVTRAMMREMIREELNPRTQVKPKPKPVVQPVMTGNQRPPPGVEYELPRIPPETSIGYRMGPNGETIPVFEQDEAYLQATDLWQSHRNMYPPRAKAESTPPWRRSDERAEAGTKDNFID